MELSYHLLDVFTDRPFSGNQLAVFPAVPVLSDALMQRIARELNLSETVFVTPPSLPGATHRMRIFTPGMELPFAGHPTVGTASLLATLSPSESSSAAFVLEQGVGLVPASAVRTVAGLWEAWLTAPRAPEVRTLAATGPELASLIGLLPEELLDGEAGPRAISAGVAFTMIPLRSAEALSRARLDVGRWKTLVGGSWAPHVYCFAVTGPLAARARMFAPAMGIEEDPATGGAAVALSGYLHAVHPSATATARWTIAQGEEVGRPSTLLLDISHARGALDIVRLGGTSVIVGAGTLRVPDTLMAPG